MPNTSRRRARNAEEPAVNQPPPSPQGVDPWASGKPASTRRNIGAAPDRTAPTPADAAGVGEALSFELLRASSVRGHDSSLARAMATLFGRNREPALLPELTAAAQAPVTTGRRIAVFSTRGGAGTTTTTALLARFFAAARPDRVAALDAAEEHGTLDLRLGRSGAASSFEELIPQLTGGNLLDSPELNARMGQVTDTLAATASPTPSRAAAPGGPGSPLAATPVSLLQEAYAAVSRSFAVTLIDCPAGVTRPATSAALADAHAALWVVPATFSGVEDALAQLAAPRMRSLAASGRLLILMTQSDRAARPAAQHHAQRFAALGFEAHTLGYDAHLAAGARVRVGLIGERRRMAVAQLAARVLDVANSRDARAGQRPHLNRQGPA